MPTYYAKRFLEIFREEGPVEVAKASKRFLISRSPLVEQRWKMYSLKKAWMEDHTGIGDPLRVYRVDPRELHYIYSGDRVDFITNGDWDIDGKKHVDDWFRMSMFTKHFEHGIPWRDIEEYQMLEETIRDRGWVGTLDIPKEEHSVEKLYEYHMFIDELYNKIKDYGYKSQKELTKKDDFAKRDKHHSLNEIQVRISRDGEIMPSTGYHRFTIAKILGINSVPVRTTTRHLEWQKLRDKIHNNGLPEGREDLRDHPELQDILD